MNILFVLEYYHPHAGGVEVMFRNLAEGLVRERHQVTVLTQRLPRTKKKEALNGVTIHRISSGNRYLFTFLAIPAAITLAAEADIIHTTTFNGAPPAWVAARLRRKKVLITVHEVWVNFWRQLGHMSATGRFLHDVLERLIYALPYDFYACVSQSTQRQLLKLGIPERKTAAVYNGVDYAHFNPKKYSRETARKKLQLNKFTVLTASRPGVSKGIEHLISALPLTKKEFTLLLMLSKSNAYHSSYNTLLRNIAAVDKKHQVRVLEPVPWEQLPPYFAAADAICIPSLSEGFGYVAAEAAAMGIPVIATNATSLPEVVSGKHIFVEPKSAAALAKGIDDAIAGKWQQKPLRKFTIRENVGSYLKLYQQLLRNG